jgi:hypothetical protein
MVGLNAITREACNTAQHTEDKREKIQALSLAKECYSMKLDLLTNATVVDDVVRFVSHKSSHSRNEDDKEESNEPDHNDDKDQLEEKQEGETGKINATTNEIF